MISGHCNVKSLLSILTVSGSPNLVLQAERRGGAAHFVAGRALSEGMTAEVRKMAYVNDTVMPTFYICAIHTDAFSSSVANTDCHKHQEIVPLFLHGGRFCKSLLDLTRR